MATITGLIAVFLIFLSGPYHTLQKRWAKTWPPLPLWAHVNISLAATVAVFVHVVLLGEILHPPVEVGEGTSVEVHPVEHPLMMVMTAVCDLEQDFNIRFPDLQHREDPAPAPIDEGHPNVVPHSLLCEAYPHDQIRPRIKGSDIWRRIEQNQDERYHRFPEAQIGDPSVGDLSAIYLDFRKSLALPTSSLYDGLRSNQIQRAAVVPPIHVHDLMHRFYSYLSRVGIPTG